MEEEFEFPTEGVTEEELRKLAEELRKRAKELEELMK